MIHKELFKNAKDRQAYMKHVVQENLHPGRNRHYQSGRQRDTWYPHERTVYVSDPTKQVVCYAKLFVQDTLPDKTMKHKFITEPMSLTAIETYIADHNRLNKDFQITDQKLIHRHYNNKNNTIVQSDWFDDTLRHLNIIGFHKRSVPTASTPYGTATYRRFMTRKKDINDNQHPF